MPADDFVADFSSGPGDPGRWSQPVFDRPERAATPVGEAAAHGTAPDRPSMTMTLLGVRTTNRPPVSVGTVRVANTGNVTVRPGLFAVDDWSSAGPVPAEPPRVELRPGRHRDVLVRTRRPLVRPISRQRTGGVTVYADLGGGPVAGPVYQVEPLISRAVVTVAVAVLLVGLGAIFLRPAGGPDERAPDAAPTVVTEQPGATSAEPSPPATDPPPATDQPADGALPADVVFDVLAADDANTHTPVLVGRDRGTVALPPGGQIMAAVKVPSGWVVKRQVIGDPAGTRFRVLYLRGTDVLDLTPGIPNPSFRVDGTGTRVVIDGRDGTAGAVTVVSLPGAAAEATTALPAHVRVVDWLGAAILLSVRDADGTWRYDRWFTGRPYEEAPSLFTGSFLGTTGAGALTIHQRDGALDCIIQVPDLLTSTRQAYRCGFGVSVDSEVMLGRWSAVSPGGRFIAVPGTNGSAYFAPLPAMLSGRAGFEPSVGLPEPIVDIKWRDGFTAAVLVRGDTRMWACAASGGACRATSIDGPAGLFPVQLAARAPADG